MDYSLKIKLKNGIRFLKSENKSLVCNINNSESFFLSNECIDILNLAIEENISFNQLFEAIEDEESRKYMIKVVEKMEQLRMWAYIQNDIIDSSQVSISIDITNECNLRCKHCCVNAGEEGKGLDLSTEDIIKIIRKIIDMNPNKITISGGEPLMRKDFCRLIEEIRSGYNGFIILMTNATLVDTKMAQFINKHIDAVDVSIDGSDEESCSLLRGKGVFDKCINGINLLKKAGVEKMTASMVKTSENQYALSDFIKLCEDLGVNSMIRLLDEAGRAEQVYDKIKIDNKVMEYQCDQKKIEENFINNKIYKIKPQVFACQGAKREFQIDYRGNIFPCAALMDDEFCLGNISEIEDLKDYIENKRFENTVGYKEFFKLLPFNLIGCKDCNKNLLCFSCVNEIRRIIKSKDYNMICKDNMYYFDLYWRDYESI